MIAELLEVFGISSPLGTVIEFALVLGGLYFLFKGYDKIKK